RITIRSWKLASLLFWTALLQIDGVPNLARGYSLGILLTIVAMIAFERWRRDARFKWLAAWTVTMIYLSYTHYVGLLFVVPYVIANIMFGKRQLFFATAAILVIA